MDFDLLRKIELMYLRKISVQYQSEGRLQPCPIKWLDNFSMRNFTNDPIFDDTLPVADGLMRIGTRVPLNRLQEAMEDWFRKKSYLAKEAKLVVQEGG
jgi:hypothetical protein